MDGVRPLLLIRADANSQIGSGHLMRCWALAQAWMRRGGRAAFASRPLPSGLESRITASGGEIFPLSKSEDQASEARQVRGLARSLAATWLVLDGYEFDFAYQQIVADGDSEIPMLWIDDSHSPQQTVADLVLNQNVFANPAAYPTVSAERLLCGPRFALLRSEFRPDPLHPPAASRTRSLGQTTQPQHDPTKNRVLVTLGGADLANGTAEILRGLALIGSTPLEVTVVLGASNPHGDAIRQLAATLPLSIRIESNVAEMAARIKSCDLAIAAAGTTAYELAACGVPAILVVTADNQAPVAEGMAAAGSALNLGNMQQISLALWSERTASLLADENRRQAMAEAGRTLVDGSGAERVVDELLERAMQIRKGTIDDARLLYAWQQDPAVRAASFTAGPGDFTQHVLWLERALADPNSLIEIFMLGTSPLVIGCVRWAIQDRRATIGIVVDPAYRGRGLAALMLRRAVRRLRETRPDIAAIDAWIRPENQSSRRSFAAAGFERQRADHVLGQPAELWQFEIVSVVERNVQSAAA